MFWSNVSFLFLSLSNVNLCFLQLIKCVSFVCDPLSQIIQFWAGLILNLEAQVIFLPQDLGPQAQAPSIPILFFFLSSVFLIWPVLLLSVHLFVPDLVSVSPKCLLEVHLPALLFPTLQVGAQVTGVRSFLSLSVCICLLAVRPPSSDPGLMSPSHRCLRHRLLKSWRWGLPWLLCLHSVIFRRPWRIV